MYKIRSLYLCPTLLLRRTATCALALRLKLRAFTTQRRQQGQNDIVKLPEKPSICTADELHYVSVCNCDWRLALWRYLPSPQAPKRNHPLLLLSGVGTNAIGYDLSPESSFARYMSSQGFDTWILEVRGAGLSVQGSSPEDIKLSANALSDQMEAATNDAHTAEGSSPEDINMSASALSDQMEAATNDAHSIVQQSRGIPSALADSVMSAAEGDPTKLPTLLDESKSVTKLTETFMYLSERLSGFLSESQSKIISVKLLDQISELLEGSQLVERFNEIREKFLGLSKTRKSSGIANQIKELSQRLVDIVEEGQRSVSPPLFDLQARFNSTIEDFQKQLELIVKYDWDFDHYLEEDVPAAMEYVREQSRSTDGRLLAIGHSMGGILLYALISRYSFEGRDPRLAAVVTLGSSLDYTSSKSMLKLLLPLADPAQALNVPVIPLGTMLAAAYPLSSRSPYILSWLSDFISAENMMHPELFKKLVLNNFCTIPVKLILQLTTAFREGGLQDRSGTFFYRDHIHKSNVPVLALAGDKDLICPPEAVEETVKLMPKHLVTYKVFGQSGGPHYAHYDLVGGRLAIEQVYPCIVEFLGRHDLP